MLDQDVAKHVAEGWTVESRTATQVVLVRKKRIGLVFNGLMTWLTGGVWAGVVAYDALNRKVERKVLGAGSSEGLDFKPIRFRR